MKELMGKIGRLCENHVEKIVLVVVGAVCVWLFFTRVIFSPNVMAVDRTNKMFTPGQIDRYIYEQKAQELRAKLQQSKKSAARTYARRFDGPIDAKDPVIAEVLARPLPKGFAGLFESPLSFLDTTTTTTKPAVLSASRRYADRKYRLPLIPEVTSVGANLIRAAAYVPLQEITPQATYDKVVTEPNDIDLVTVEARFDVAEVFRRFQASFAGVDVQKEEWRDPCLAKPIFAAVQLQRQELLDNGFWDDWRPIPRSRVETNRELFQVFERIEDLPPGGLDVRLMHFNNEMITTELLQPESYQIASAEEEWFPPSYYGKFKDLQRKMDSEKRREEKEKDRKQTDRGGTDLRREATGRGGQAGAYGPTQGGTRGAPGSSRIRGGAAGGAGGMPGDPMSNPRGARGGRIAGGPGGMPGDPMMGGRGRTPPRRGGAGDPYGDMYGMPGDMGMRGRTTTNEVYWDFAADMIAYREDLSKRDKPLLFWVFDDTVEPGKIYQYRVRLGVFNPVAGTGQVADRDMDKKDQVILWSPYSEVTRPIEVQRRIYLFAKDVQDKTKTATVEVARYALGYWRSENFQVRPGETIGKELEPKKEDDKTKSRARLAGGYPDAAMMPDRITDLRGGMGGMPGYMGPGGLDQQNVPKKVNYRTGKVLVDLVQVNDWGNAPNLRPRLYFDMLYTGDGMRIEHMPVNATNWPKDLAAAYQYIQAEKRKEPQPFRAFSKSGMMRGRDALGGMEGYDDLGMYEDMGGYEGGGGMYPY